MESKDVANKTNSTIHKKLKQEQYDIHYFVSGNKGNEMVILLHPAFSDHRAFELQIDYFSKDYYVITIDLIGHGLSKALKSKDKIDESAKHIAAILERESYDNAHIVGVSMGSLVAQYFALKYPEKVISLTSLGGYNINKKNKEVETAQRSSNFGLALRALISLKLFRTKTSRITAFTSIGQSLFYKSTSLYERKSFLVMQGFRNIIKDRLQITTEYATLIITGEHDIELAKKMAEEWHLGLEKSEFQIIKNAGHCANMDDPDKFNKLVIDFIKRKSLL